MKVLITGNCGFIGSHLHELLVSQGYEVIGLDNRRWSTRRMNGIIGDVLDKRLVEGVLSRVDEVYHLAAQINVDYGNEHPEETLDINIRGTLNVLEACKKYKKRLIYASTSEVYGTALSTFVCLNCKNVQYYPSKMAGSMVGVWATTSSAGNTPRRSTEKNTFGPRQATDRKKKSELEGRRGSIVPNVRGGKISQTISYQEEQANLLQQGLLGKVPEVDQQERPIESQGTKFATIQKLGSNGQEFLQEQMSGLPRDHTPRGAPPHSTTRTASGVLHDRGRNQQAIHLGNGTLDPAVQATPCNDGQIPQTDVKWCQSCGNTLTTINEKISEEHPTRVQSVYAASKLGAERLCKAYADAFDVDARILRNFNTFGPHQRIDSYGGVIAIFVDRALHHKPALINGDGRQERDYIWISDALKGYQLIAESGRPGEPINIGSGVTVTVNDIAELVRKYTGCPKPIYQAPRPGEVRRLCADTTKAGALGFAPETDFEKHLYLYIQWRKHQLGLL